MGGRGSPPEPYIDHAGFDPPLRIDWIGSDLLADGRPGRIGLTILPGKQGRSTRYPGRVYERDLDEDVGSLLSAGVSRLVLLVEDHELRQWSDPQIVARAAAQGLEVLRFPIPDGSPPSDDAELRTILDAVRSGRSEGDVAVACMGGVGRTGTIAACALVDAGMPAETAIATVRAIRHPQAVETVAQEQFVRNFARERSGAAPRVTESGQSAGR
jgi:protein-tyrosine phosphatase